MFIFHILTLSFNQIIFFHWYFGGRRWFANLYLDPTTFWLIPFWLCFNRMRNFYELFWLAFRCDPWWLNILFYSLEGLCSWIQRIVHPISLHNLNAFHFWIVYFDFSYVLKLIWALSIRSLLLISTLLPQDFLHMMNLRLLVILIKSTTTMMRKLITLPIYFSNHLILLINWWIWNLLLLSVWFDTVVGTGIISLCLIIRQIIWIIVQIEACMISPVCSFWSSATTLRIFAVSKMVKIKMKFFKNLTYW